MRQSLFDLSDLRKFCLAHWLRQLTRNVKETFSVNGWMDDLRFYVLFKCISVISGRREVDNERLCAMEPRLRLRRFCIEQGSNSGPLDQ